MEHSEQLFERLKYDESRVEGFEYWWTTFRAQLFKFFLRQRK